MHPRHETFARHVADGVTLTAAAEAAGYGSKSAHVTGSRLYAKPEIKAEVARLKSLRDGSSVNPVAVQSVKRSSLAQDAGAQLSPMSPVERLTREHIVYQLLRNVDISMGDELVTERRAVKHIVRFDDGQVREVWESVEVRVTARDAASANRSLELLDKQLDKLREDAERQPDGKGELNGEYLSAAVQGKVDQARKILGSRFKEAREA